MGMAEDPNETDAPVVQETPTPEEDRSAALADAAVADDLRQEEKLASEATAREQELNEEATQREQGLNKEATQREQDLNEEAIQREQELVRNAGGH